MHQFKDKSAEQQLVRTSLASASGPAGGGHPALQDRRGAGRRRPAPARRARPRDRAALQHHLRRGVRRAGARDPDIGARIMDLQEPDAKMSTSSSTEAGLIYIDDEPDAIMRKVKRAQTDSGSEVVRARQAGDHEPDRHARRGPRRNARPDRARLRRPGLRRSSGRGRSSSSWHRSASATRSSAPTRRYRGDAARAAPSARPRDRHRDNGRGTRRDGNRPEQGRALQRRSQAHEGDRASTGPAAARAPPDGRPPGRSTRLTSAAARPPAMSIAALDPTSRSSTVPSTCC